MKNALRIIAVVVVAALLFGAGFGLGSSNGIKISVQYSNSGDNSGNAGTASTPVDATPAAPAETTAPAPAETTAPAPAAPADNGDSTTAAPAPADKNDAPAASTSGVPGSKAEIVKAYNDVIAKTKNVGNVKVVKDSKIDVKVTDCSISFATSLVNGVVQKFLTDSSTEYNFVDGQDTNSDKQLNNLIPPSGRDAALKEEYVSQASASPSGSGYVIKLNIVSETSTFDGTNTKNPDANTSILDPLNLASLDIAPAKIASANMNYPGSTVEAVVNANGTLDKLTVNMPMDGRGSGQISKFTVEVGLAGELGDTYTFTY